MTTTTFFFVFIPVLAVILLAVNLIFAPHNPYQEKDSAFECGFHSFLGQNRTQFSISFFIFALLFLLFDLEILLVYPYVVSAYTNGIYGLVIMLIFFLALTLGFAFELGKNALKIDSRQVLTFVYYNKTNLLVNISSMSVFKLKNFISRMLRNITVAKFIVSSFTLSFLCLLR
jgi:NADH-ubiquinone oxidoreductase chain 3